MKQSLLLGVSVCVLSACAQQPPAPIALKGDKFYGKDGVRQFAQRALPTPDYTPPAQAEAAPAAQVDVATLSQPAPIASRELDAPAAKIHFSADAPVKPASLEFKTVNLAAKTPELQVAEAQTLQAPAAQQLAPLPMDDVSEPSLTQALAAAAPQPQAEAPKLAELGERASNFIWPVEGAIVSRFGPKQNGLVNDGINIAAREGEPIWAAAKGDVVYAGNELKGYGNMVIIKHANGWMTAYAHASDMLVNKGDRVSQGDLIGYVGQTGAVTSAQLHFGVREGKTPVDPENLLPRRVASAQ